MFYMGRGTHMELPLTRERGRSHLHTGVPLLPPPRGLVYTLYVCSEINFPIVIP